MSKKQNMPNNQNKKLSVIKSKKYIKNLTNCKKEMNKNYYKNNFTKEIYNKKEEKIRLGNKQRKEKHKFNKKKDKIKYHKLFSIGI